MVIVGNIRRGSASTMADPWLVLERAKSSFVPVLLFLLALYFPIIQISYAQSLPRIDMEMKGFNENCVEGQTIMLYCHINGVSSASEYEVNWTKGVRDSPNSGVTLVTLDKKRVTNAKWETGDTDSVTYILRLDNATVSDSGVYTCQIFYRYTNNRGTHSWATTSRSWDISVRVATGPLPQCVTNRRNNLFYSNEHLRLTCISHVDDVTLTWMKQNVNRSEFIIADMRIRNKDVDDHSLIIPVDESLNGASFVCSQFSFRSSEGNCIIGPIRVIPAPTQPPTITISPLTTTEEVSPTLLRQSTELPVVPKLNGYQDADSMRKVNQTVPIAKHTTAKLCPEFVYILVPTAIAVISVILNLYLIIKLRHSREAVVDKMCDNRHCDTRYQSGSLDKDEYCTCGYMLKLAQHDTEV